MKLISKKRTEVYRSRSPNKNFQSHKILNNKAHKPHTLPRYNSFKQEQNMDFGYLKNAEQKNVPSNKSEQIAFSSDGNFNLF